MCLIYIHYQAHPDYPLIIVANRDEFYQRPTDPIGYWDEAPDLVAGRDLKSGGTWLGVTRTGRIAAITNYRDPASIKQNAPSRGDLVTGYLLATDPPFDWILKHQRHFHRYNGFNLVVGTVHELIYLSNKKPGIHRLSPGLYGISNRFLDTPWPKLQKGKEKLRGLLTDPQPDIEALFDVMTDKTKFPDHTLPNTGMDLEWERILSSIFIESPVYGTRCTSIILFHKDGQVRFVERSFPSPPPNRTASGETVTREIRFTMDEMAN